jgi:hypothetical protein
MWTDEDDNLPADPAPEMHEAFPTANADEIPPDEGDKEAENKGDDNNDG